MYYLFVTDDRENASLFIYEDIEEAHAKIDSLEPFYDFRLIAGEEI